MAKARDVLAALLLTLATGVSASAVEFESDDRPPTNKGVDLRSHGRQVADEVRRKGQAMPGAVTALGARGSKGRGEEEDRRDREDRRDKEDRREREDRRDKESRNVQVNDPALDHLQTLPGTRPFEFSIQSETSVAVFRNNIVIGYNSSADQTVVQTDSGLLVEQIHLSGFSVSHDGGRTWKSGFVPPVPGSPFTFGDPSVVVDRAGHFYYASLGTDSDAPVFTRAIIINKSTDGGATWAPATIVARDAGADKPWLAVGPDPIHKTRDNLYVAWTSFQPGGRSELRFARSTDGGASWSPQAAIFAPVDTGPAGLSAFIHFANPTVDRSTGRLFIPFLHLGNRDADLIRALVSDDAGDAFTLLEFNVPGAPDTAGVPNVTPGTLSDCGSGGTRPVLSQGEDLGGGRFFLPRFRQSTRLITQPSAAAVRGKLVIAFNSSTSAVFGDRDSRSEIRLLFSPDGGRTFLGPFTMAVATEADPRHVLPSVSLDADGEDVRVAYYVQQADGKVRVDLAGGEIEDEGNRFSAQRPARVSSVAFDLTPSNNPLPNVFNPFFTANYDQAFAPCYSLGEYLAVTRADERVLVAWGDNRNPWTSPACADVEPLCSPAPGRHAQSDVFFQRMER
jgi:hypothetical protein